jgi:DNA adenine methylase
MRYHGGKWRLAPWIISHFPEHQVYVEPYGGAASVLLRKPRSYAEIYNDMDGEVVNLFRVARDHGQELIRLVASTPFARAEFDTSYEASPDPIEQARRTMVRSGMGWGSTATSVDNRTGFRGSAMRTGTHPALDWMNQAENLGAIVARLRGVVIENRPAIELMSYHDTPQTLHYVDPPYVQETRSWNGGKGAYRHEMDDSSHAELLDHLRGLRGMVIISGYPSPLYSEALAGWACHDRAALADRAAARTEALWISPNCRQPHPEMFP